MDHLPDGPSAVAIPRLQGGIRQPGDERPEIGRRCRDGVDEGGAGVWSQRLLNTQESTDRVSLTLEIRHDASLRGLRIMSRGAVIPAADPSYE